MIESRPITATCYVCGEPFECDDRLATVPPDYRIVLERIEAARGQNERLDLGRYIAPVQVCFNPECQWKEMQRQDAIYQQALEPERERIKVEIESARNKAKRGQ